MTNHLVMAELAHPRWLLLIAVPIKNSAYAARALALKRPELRSAPNEREDSDEAVVRLRRLLSEILAIVFFDSLGRQTAEGLVSELESKVREQSASANAASFSTATLCNRVWVTRKGLLVDRLATAWLIRRFIDPEARFKFVPPRGYRAEIGEMRFDMFDAEFTYKCDRCTFEVLMQRTGLAAQGLRELAEIVHDIDLKDGKFGHPETAASNG